MIIDQRIIIII